MAKESFTPDSPNLKEVKRLHKEYVVNLISASAMLGLTATLALLVNSTALLGLIPSGLQYINFFHTNKKLKAAEKKYLKEG